MAFVQSLFSTYEALVKSAKLLGSRPSNPLYIGMGNTKPLIFKALRNSSNSDELAIDGSVTPVEFYITPDTNENWIITEWSIIVRDGKGFTTGAIGSNGVLTNGLQILFESNSVQTPILDYTIKTNADIFETTYDTKIETAGNDFDILVARWNFNDIGSLIKLNSATTDKLIVKVQDNLTSLTSLKIKVKGYKI